MRDASPITFT